MSNVYQKTGKRIVGLELNGEVYYKLDDIKAIIREYGERYWHNLHSEAMIQEIENQVKS